MRNNASWGCFNARAQRREDRKDFLIISAANDFALHPTPHGLLSDSASLHPGYKNRIPDGL